MSITIQNNKKKAPKYLAAVAYPRKISLDTNINPKNPKTTIEIFKHQKFSLKILEQSSLSKQANKHKKYKTTRIADILYTALTPKHTKPPPLASGQ